MYDVRAPALAVRDRRPGSLTGAAAALDFTQPAISQHLAALEAEVGAPLVNRSRGGAELTAAGRAAGRARPRRARPARARRAPGRRPASRRSSGACGSPRTPSSLDPARAARGRRPAPPDARRRGHDHGVRPAEGAREAAARRRHRRRRDVPPRGRARRPRASRSERCSRSRCTRSVPRRHPLAEADGGRARGLRDDAVDPGPVRDLARA